MRWQHVAAGFLAGLVFILPQWAWAISPGQTANFQDGTIQGWTNGGVRGPLPANITDGGPAGVGDHYLQVSSGSIGDNSFPPHLLTFNQTTFMGDYVAAGISAVAMDLKNFSPADPVNGVPTLPMRFTISANTGGNGPAYVSNEFDLVPDGAWHHVVFLFTSDFNPYFTSDTFSSVLAGVEETRILAATGPALTGDSGNFRFGVDNIQAIVRGDWNRDGSVTSADLQVMLNALTDLNAYKTTNSVDAKTLLAIGDFSGDGSVTNADIQPMLNLLASAGAGSFAAVPEPSAILLGLVAAAGFWMRRRPVAA